MLFYTQTQPIYSNGFVSKYSICIIDFTEKHQWAPMLKTLLILCVMESYLKREREKKDL